MIPPAWYQTNWFRALCAAAFLTLLWGLYHLRVLQLRREFNAALEARVGERTRVARDLHDTLLQSFHGAVAALQAAIYRLRPNPVRCPQKELRSAVDAGGRRDHGGAGMRCKACAFDGRDRTILPSPFRRLEKSSLLPRPIRPRPSFKVVVEGTSRNLHPILRDEVYRIAAEALRNAFRHAAAQNDRSGNSLRRKVISGFAFVTMAKVLIPRWFASDGREGHYGLRGMRERRQDRGREADDLE